MNVPSSPFHSLLLKLSNKGMSFLFPPLKLSNKGMEEYFKIILFILFHSITFSPSKRSLRVPINQTHNTKHFYYTFFFCVISQAKSFFFLISFFFQFCCKKYLYYYLRARFSPCLGSSFFLLKNVSTSLCLSTDKTKRQFGKNTTLTLTKILPKK